MRRLAPEARSSGLRPERLRRAGRVRGLGLGRVSVPPIAVAGLLLLALGGSGPVSGRAAEANRATARAARAVERSTLSFLPDEGSRFVARGPGYGIALAPDEVRVAGPTSPAPLRMRLVGARPDASGRGELPGRGRTNLLLGDDPAGWRTGLAAYGRVTYAGVWDGIDVVYHGRGPQLEQDFVVAPGADAAAISLSFADARGLRLDSNGDLVVALPGGEVRLGRPTLYQEADGGRLPVPGAFAVHGDRVGFHVGRHDPTRPLVIDPVLLESSYLGGSANDAAYGVAVDDAGNVYVTGLSESPDFPTASPQQGALVEDAGVRTDAFVAKLNPEGTGFVYSTFLGGKARDTGHAIAVSPDGSAVIAGYTESSDFPLARPIQKEFGGGPSDAFVARISPEGAVLQYSTYVGGSGTDTARGVALSQSGDAYLVGSTTSGDFPVAGAPLRGTLTKPDDSDAYVTRVNAAGSEFVYSTYLGGDGEDHALAVGVDLVGNAYVAGDTRSPDFPTAKAFQPGVGGGVPGVAGADADAFVSKLDPNGSALVYSTYLGGGESDQAASIAVEGDGNAYVTGSTGSTNFPVIRPAQPRKNGDFDAFVAKLSPEGPLFWSTYLGGSASDGGGGVAVDGAGRASVTGATASTDFPTVEPFQPSKAGGFVDGFVATYDEAGAALTQSSYVGGREDDQGTAIAVDGEGTLHVTGYTNSTDFPTAKPFQPAKGGGAGDVFVATVGEPLGAAEAERTTSSPARDRRIRFFLVTTIVLFLAAIGQTLWLRRRPAGPPAPAGVGDLAVTRVEPDWYAASRRPPRLSDITPTRPRPVPAPAPAPAARRRRPTRPADVPPPAEVAVPDLLPEGEEGLWAPEAAPADRAETESGAARGAPVENDLPPPPPPPIDVAAPDLWGPSEAEPELADDTVWAELLGADPADLSSLPPPPVTVPRPPSPRPPPPPPPPPEADAVVADALAAEGAATEAPHAEPPRAPDLPAAEPVAEPAVEPVARDAPPPEPDLDAEADVVVVVPRPPPEPSDDEPAATPKTEDEDGAEDWMTALWGPTSPPPLPPESEAGAADGADAPRSADLSISDLLAEDLPIPEAEEQALSIRDLLAEDLEVPTPGEPPPAGEEPPAAEERPPVTAEEPPPASAEEPAPAAEEPAAEAEAPPPREEPTPPAPEESPPPPAAGADDDQPPPEGEPPQERPKEPRPLPEAAPGRSLGGRLRRAWHPHGRES